MEATLEEFAAKLALVPIPPPGHLHLVRLNHLTGLIKSVCSNAVCSSDVPFASSDHRVAVQRRQGPPSGGFGPPPAPPVLPAAAAAAGIGRTSRLRASPSVTLVSVRVPVGAVLPPAGAAARALLC